MSKFHYTDPTTQARSADRSGLRQVRGLGLVVDLSAQSRHVRTLSVGLVWSGRRQSINQSRFFFYSGLSNLNHELLDKVRGSV